MTSKIKTNIIYEIPVAENSTQTAEFYLRGYALTECIQKANALDIFWLLFKPEKPTKNQQLLFNQLLQLCACVSPREPTSHAAMSAGVSQGPTAAMIIAALAANAGVEGGARELYHCAINWRSFQAHNFESIEVFESIWKQTHSTKSLIWPNHARPAGLNLGKFDNTLVSSLLCALAKDENFHAISWLKTNMFALQEQLDSSVNLMLVASAAFFDLGFDADQSETLFLIFSLLGSSAYGLEQKANGFTQFPFPTIEFV